MNQVSPQARYSWFSTILSGGLISAWVAVLDTLSNYHIPPAGFESFALALLPFTLVAAAVFTLYLIFTVGAYYLLRPLNPSPGPLAAAVAVVVGADAILLQLHGPIVALVAMIVVCWLGVIVYIIAVRITKSPQASLFCRRAAVTILAMAGAVFVCSWVTRFPLHISAAQSAMRFQVLSLAGFLAIAAPLVFLTREKLGKAFGLAVALVAWLIVLPHIPAASPFAGSENFSKSTPLIKSVVLIVVDTLRADALSPDACDTASTPNMCSLASDSIVFRDAISPASWTIPAMASIMTGVSPDFHGVGGPMPECAFPTLASFLRRSNYHTQAVIGNGIVSNADKPRSKTDGATFSDGFVVYNAYSANRLGESLAARFWEMTDSDFVSGGNTEAVTRLATDSLDANSGNPFFLWWHLYDPHTPYAPPKEFRDRISSPQPDQIYFHDELVRTGERMVLPEQRVWIQELYEAEIRFVDRAVGDFLQKMRSLGIYDESLIIFTSDHGEEFWEHDKWGHGHSVYDELLRVPLLIKLPGSAATGTIQSTVPTQALLPTILDLCGIPYDPQPGWPPSLTPLCRRGADDSYPEPIVSSNALYWEEQAAVFHEGRKLIWRRHSDREELYDRRVDPLEQVSILAQNREQARDLKDIIQRQLVLARQIRKERGIDDDVFGWDEETLKRLKGMGYLK